MPVSIRHHTIREYSVIASSNAEKKYKEKHCSEGEVLYRVR